MNGLENIIASLENKHKDWVLDDSYSKLEHIKTKICIYISDQETVMLLHPVRLRFTRVEKTALWLAVQHCLNDKLNQECKKL